MQIVGLIGSKEEVNEVTFIAKMFLIGQRARFLARTTEEQVDKTVDKMLMEVFK